MTKKEKRQLHINSMMAKPNAKREIFLGLEIITYDLNCVAIFVKNKIVSESHFRFKTQELREAFIAKRKESSMEELKRRETYLKTCEKAKDAFVKDAIIVSSWGYDQTNVDFFQIIERKGLTVILQTIGSKATHDRNGDSGTCTPDISNKIGEPFKKRITKSAHIKFSSFQSGHVWDGTPMCWSSYA